MLRYKFSYGTLKIIYVFDSVKVDFGRIFENANVKEYLHYFKYQPFYHHKKNLLSLFEKLNIT